jgi:hypothetical protein
MTWYERLTGCVEESPEQVRRDLEVVGDRLRSRKNGRSWRCGRLETPTLGELRARVRELSPARRATTVCELVGDVQRFHADHRHKDAFFQVASQFNLLEMISPSVTPERGVGGYEHDRTQGPACAIAAGAGTIYRNYFAPANGRIGQSEDNQIDCLADLGALLGNASGQLWRMVNGYALPTAAGLAAIDDRLASLSDRDWDALRQALRIGLHHDTQVTLESCEHVVSQAYCSALPVAYTAHPAALWKRFATLVLEAAYEATICAAILHQARTGCPRVFLTLLGGGAFGNDFPWIAQAVRRSLLLYADSGLEVAIVSYGQSKPLVRRLAVVLSGEITVAFNKAGSD